MSTDLQQLHRDSFGQLVATLTRFTGDLGLAEDVVQDAFVKAMNSWPDSGVPDSPVAWLTRTARNSAIDHMRRVKSFDDRVPEITHLTELEQSSMGTVDLDHHPALRDDMMRLIFTCCHPALNIEARVALCLRTICGLTTTEISSAFIVPEATMAQRLSRAKSKIRDAGIAYRVPDKSEIVERLDGVLAVIYLIFNESWLASSGNQGVRIDLAEQAIRLGRRACLIASPTLEPQALLALMLLQHSRRDARFDADGALVLLQDQDRSDWHGAEIREGRELIQQVFANGFGQTRYALQAAIAAVHASAQRATETDWAEIVTLYEYLMALDPSAVVALNHAVACAQRDGPEQGLVLVDRLRESASMQRYHLYHAARADLLRQLGRGAEAKQAYLKAAALTANEAERRFLQQRIEALDADA